MNRGRISKFCSVVIAGIIAISGLPSMVLADMINAPTYYSVQSELDYEITTNITSSWSNHESIDLVLTNTGSDTIHNWYLTFNTPYNIENIWNSTINETDGNGTYTITSNGWNQDIHAGESVTVGITFSSDTETELSVDPTWYLLNTQETVVDASQYTLEYIEYSAWETGFSGQLTLTPQVDCQHWELSFDSNRDITAVSSAVLTINDNNSYEITHDENNMRLYAGNIYNFGVQGVSTIDPLTLSEVALTVTDLAYHLTDDEDNNGVPDYLDFINGDIVVEPTPTPTPTVEPTDVPTETPTDEPSATPTEEPTPTPIIDTESDQDLDGLPDYIEDELGTDPLKADTDDDGLSDYIEIMIGYDPIVPDSDGDGVLDGNEDYDNDGLTNVQEIQIGTQLGIEDTDSDGLIDGDELNIYGTDPLNPDSDGDGIYDGDEIAIGKNPADPTDGATRLSQTLTKVIDNEDDPSVLSVSVTADLAGRIDRVLKIRDYYNIDYYSTDVYGRIGSPINFECDEEFNTATVVISYDETKLGNAIESDLGVLWYDEDNGIYVVQDQAVIDTANNTITLDLNHFSTYVVVDMYKWNNPVLPDYYGGLMIAEGGTTYSPLGGAVPTLESRESGCFNWWTFNFPTQQFEKLETLSAVMYSETETYSFTTWHYEYTWLAMDMTDNDQDGVLDFMERQGVLGTNHKIYYSSTTSVDGDGDGLSDSDEIGARYIVSRDENGVLRIFIGNAKVYESMDGTISPDSQYYILYEYFDSIPCGETRVLAVIRSDAQKLDSDGDESYDAVDARPMSVNPLINYIIVGVDYPNDDALDTCAEAYEAQFSNLGMRFLRLDIETGEQFNVILEHLKSITETRFEDGCRWRVSGYEFYRGIDNLIIICHGNVGVTAINPNEEYPTSNRIYASDYEGLSLFPSAHINTVDFYSCYSATDMNQAPAAVVAACFDVDFVYGFDGETTECDRNSLAGRYSTNYCNGYYCFYLANNTNGDISTEPIVECYQVMPQSIAVIRGETYFYFDLVHSRISAGE